MCLDKKELEWLELAIEDNNTYRVVVDNDCISIDKFNRDNDEWEFAFVFDSYGQELLVQLFNYIGCNADMA